MDNNRLLLQLEKSLRDINRSVINPEFEKLSISDLEPVLTLVAKARADYLKNMFTISVECPDSLPSEEVITQLKASRLCYEELVAASQALETAIERGYLDVLSS